MASNPNPDRPLAVRDLGRMPYAQALAIQREINLAVSQGRPPGDTLLLVEHDPVITLTHRPGVWDNLLATESKLKELGIAVEVTDRGGDVTYHGPGQLVAYPILQLKPLGLNLGSYMCLLEQVVIDVLAEFGIKGMREKGAIGVWVDVSGFGARGSRISQSDLAPSCNESDSSDTRAPIPDPRLAKVCAMGVRVRKNTTMHGLALNVNTDLSHFQTIDPCGLGGRPVTSLAELLGEDAPTIGDVKTTLVDQLMSSVQNLPAGNTR